MGAAGQNSYFISTMDGSLAGSGKLYSDPQGVEFKQGDRVGVLVDLGAGSLRFYLNGVQCGPGYTAGVTGPLLPAIAIATCGAVVTAVPGAEFGAPATAGGGVVIAAEATSGGKGGAH